MEAGFTSGAFVDLALVLIVAEGLFLLLRHRRSGRGPAPSAWLPGFVAGFCLAAALRAQIAGLAWPWLAAALLGALLAHAAELLRLHRGAA